MGGDIMDNSVQNNAEQQSINQVNNDSIDEEVIIVGAGLAGLCCAWAMHQKGVRVRIIERKSTLAPCFKAEKIEPEQAELLRKFGLLHLRQPYNDAIGEIQSYRYGRLLNEDTIEQYSMRYHDFVNQIREHVEKHVPIENALVKKITNSNIFQSLQLASGKELKCRLIVLATGGSGSLSKQLQMEKNKKPWHSFSIGFDINSTSSEGFNFTGFNYFTNPIHQKVGYLTLFLIGKTMRANLFTQWSARDPQSKQFVNNPLEYIDYYFPKLTDFIGPFEISSKPELFMTHYYQLSNVKQPGVVVIGDEFQSVDPSTGSGLSKLLSDVDALCYRYISLWLASDGMGVDKIREFYDDDDKMATDKESARRWSMSHKLAHNKGPLWTILRNDSLNRLLGR